MVVVCPSDAVVCPLDAVADLDSGDVGFAVGCCCCCCFEVGDD